MAEQIISPGVYTRENDLSFIQPEPEAVGAAFVGPAVKGPVNIPTIVTSYNQYKQIFGTTFRAGSDKEEFLTSIAVRNYFEQGGTTALVTRVVSGSFTSAASTKVIPSGEGVIGTVAESDPSFILETIGEGEIFNTAPDGTSNGEIGADGYLETGSRDNIRWEITGVDESNGTFTLLVRRGDDSNANPIVLETFTNLSLDPNSDNYIEKRIGSRKLQIDATDPADVYVKEVGQYPNRSKYVRVSSVPLKTYDYLDNDLNINIDSNTDPYSTYLPTAQTGAFHGATGALPDATANFYNGFTALDTQGLSTDGVTTDYDTALQVLRNKDEYQFNILIAPGLTVGEHSGVVGDIVSLADSRQDFIATLDLTDLGATITDAVTNAKTVNSSYCAAYWPFVQVRSETGKNVYVPASTVLPGVFAFNDNLSAPWFAPAGLTRGALPGVLQAERKLTKKNRDELYQGSINPIATFPGTGISIHGQKTLQKRPSALDRVNVRRLLIEVKNFFSEQARNLVFEQNTITTRNRFLATVNPYLDSIVQRQGLYSFRVVMDETNNTADVIDRNQLVGEVYLQPTRTSEIVVFDFSIEPTGATFDI